MCRQTGLPRSSLRSAPTFKRLLTTGYTSTENGVDGPIPVSPSLLSASRCFVWVTFPARPGMVSLCCAKRFEGLSGRWAGQRPNRSRGFGFTLNISPCLCHDPVRRYERPLPDFLRSTMTSFPIAHTQQRGTLLLHATASWGQRQRMSGRPAGVSSGADTSPIATV